MLRVTIVAKAVQGMAAARLERIDERRINSGRAKQDIDIIADFWHSAYELMFVWG